MAETINEAFDFSDRGRLTWNEPPPTQIVQAVANPEDHSSSRQLHEGTINAYLSWQFYLTELNFSSLVILFDGTTVAGVTSLGYGPEHGFENKFDIDWIPKQTFVRLIIFNVTAKESGTFTCRVAVHERSGFASFQFDSNVQVDVVAPPSIIASSSDLNYSADEKPKPTMFDDTVVTTPLNFSRGEDGGGRCTADNAKCLPKDVKGLAGYVWYIIGSVVAVLAVFIVGFLVWWMKYRKPHKTPSDEEKGSPTANGTDGTVGQEVEMAAPIPVYAEVPADHTEVDKSKKKKKIEDENLNGTLDETKKEKKPGKLLSAGLGVFQNSGMPTVSISTTTSALD
ncbi:PREDICTED: uncharacterized protein LOC107353119 [Acropora digitifera]|uniref:uncharacterized protein LOC107353119 n=1 Tax=Acropora digitifera TaxID=70779 RepID=UPI00077A0BC1|nr:PREDICTED: uncharacterized protein LOC107353119 [Acropora digitifera]